MAPAPPGGEDRGGDVRGAVGGPAVAPEQRPVCGPDPGRPLAAEEHHMGGAGQGNRHRRGVSGLVVRGGPEQFPGLPIEGGEPGVPPPRRHQHPVAEHQRRLADPPTDVPPAGLPEQVHGPDHLAAGGVERRELAARPEDMDAPGDHRRRRPRSVAAAVAVALAVRGRPEPGARGGVECDDPFAPGQHPEGVDPALRHRDRGITVAEPRGPESERRPAFGPAPEQTGFAGDAVPVRAAPLRPVLAGGGESGAEGEPCRDDCGEDCREEAGADHGSATPVPSHRCATGRAAARRASRWSRSFRPPLPVPGRPGRRSRVRAVPP